MCYHFDTGFAAGSYYADKGGGVNYQCLPLQPEYNAYDTNLRGTTVISGAEYQSDENGIFPSVAQEQNVPCARCLTPRSATMMYPAKRNCPSGWTIEYEGKRLYLNIPNFLK